MRREAYIRTFTLPQGLFDRLRKKHPDLTLKDCQLIAHALRQFFLTHLKSGRKFVAMPSQIADDLWHEFILYTKNYQAFCHAAFGRFLHHSPAVVLGGSAPTNAGLRRCWWYACREENINPRKATRLPLLFALDAKLNVADGFRYVADCQSVRRQAAGSGAGGNVYCGGDFSSSDFAGGTDGFADGAGAGSGQHGGEGGASGGGGADASGCGGSSGCGGGGCGGDS
jgi:hypothetical protein